MINKFFKHSIRALNRQKGYLLINIIGLSIGISCSLIIALFIIHELSYDRFNKKEDRIYRAVINGIVGDREVSYAISSPPLGPTLLKEFPEVEDFDRMMVIPEVIVKNQDKSFVERGFIASDSSFFNMFSIPIVKGNKNTALREPHTLVISESTAKKLFGDNDPINKSLFIGNDSIPFRITGVMADIPETSHFSANMIASLITYKGISEDNWGNNSFVTYILLKPLTKPESVNAKMPEIVRKYIGPIVQQQLGISIEDFIAKNKYRIYLQPLRKIHFDPTITQQTKPAINPKYLYIFGSIALLIIIIAVINFMNLSVAQASKRAKEVGIKKVSGSSRRMLIRQFLTESVLLSIISLVLAVIITENILPYLNNLLGAKLDLNLFSNYFTIPLLIILSVFVGLLAGSYPAFILSSFNPYIVLKEKLSGSLKKSRMRNILVVIQFSISILLIVGTIIMVRQIRFMINKDLGFDKDRLLVITNAGAIGGSINAFKNTLTEMPEISKVTASTAVPGHSQQGLTYTVENNPGEVIDFKINYVDNDFFDTYSIQLFSGRFFNKSFATDKDACIINENTLKQLNLPDPNSTMLISGNDKQTIIGVVKNFNFESLRSEISPYIFRPKGENRNYGYISVRLSKKVTANTIKKVEEAWNEYAPDKPFQYFFMDQDFASKYKDERQNARLSVLFTILALVIASLGLFGLVSFTIEQRTKEIGIRKIMGASVASIFYLVSREFILLVFISALISWLLIYFIARNWLQNFYYRINLQPLDFLTGLIIAFVIAFITIGYRIIKSARTNPVEALRYE